MLKMILPSMLILPLFNISLPISIILTSSITMFLLMKFSYMKTSIFNHTLYMDQLSFIMILLSTMSTILILISSSTMMNILPTISSIFIILLITFSMSNPFNFYIMFELILIPTMILITKLGMQPERLQAGVYLTIYTITASLPLLASILFMLSNSSFPSTFNNLFKFNFPILLMMAFLVKMPMFFFHLWLPKAHVEAPLEGSMILAAILLKLGGYGLIRFIPMCIHKMYKMNFWIVSISMIGAMLTNLNCIRQNDLKSLIAYSSVSHMAFVLASMFSINYMGLMGATMLMFAHGLSSSALFLLVNDMYQKYHTRNISSLKGIMIMSPNMTFWWFMFTAINISAPPSINTISEILIMSSLILWNKKMMTIMFLSMLATASFSLSMFINISHNKNEMLPSYQTQQKIYLSLFLHLLPLVILLMKMEMMNIYMSSL